MPDILPDSLAPLVGKMVPAEGGRGPLGRQGLPGRKAGSSHPGITTFPASISQSREEEPQHPALGGGCHVNMEAGQETEPI